jgi:succinoglycan biosynthesis protein ExoO
MTLKQPKVSIIMPAYNTQAYIAKAIESALMQTEKDIEIIVIDDCSEDDTLKIAQSFTDERVKVFSNLQKGKSAACNLGLEQAKGEWVTNLDSDDWYAPNRIEKLLQYANNIDNVDMIADDLYYIRDGENKPWSTFLAQSKGQIDSIKHIDIKFFLENDVPSQWSLPLGITKSLFRRDFLKKHNIRNKENLRRGDDFWFVFMCLAHGANFVFVPEPYYFYRSRPGSLVAGSRLLLMNEQCSATKYYLQQDYVRDNLELVNLLSKRMSIIEKTKPYFYIIDLLRKKEFLKSLSEIMRYPYFFRHLMTELPRILFRRISYYWSRINQNSQAFADVDSLKV